MSALMFTIMLLKLKYSYRIFIADYNVQSLLVQSAVVLRNQPYARFNDDRKSVKRRLEQQGPVVYRNAITLLG
jgi:hypothetical protein